MELLNGIPDYKDASEHISYCEEMIAAVKAYEQARHGAEAKNVELQSAIDRAQTLLAENGIPLEEELIPALETAISETKAQKAELPEMPETAEELYKAADEMNGIEYTEILEKLEKARVALEKSIAQYALVNHPSESYVIQCLGNVKHVVDISAATEKNDPNGKLNKAGGYTAQVYFSSDQVNQKSVSGKTVIEKGTECGGSIEVYENVEDALARNDYLAAFDGGILSSGSHTVVGTCVIRASDKLTASQQKKFEESIIAALTKLEEQNEE